MCTVSALYLANKLKQKQLYNQQHKQHQMYSYKQNKLKSILTNIIKQTKKTSNVFCDKNINRKSQSQVTHSIHQTHMAWKQAEADITRCIRTYCSGRMFNEMHTAITVHTMHTHRQPFSTWKWVNWLRITFYKLSNFHLIFFWGRGWVIWAVDVT